MLTSLFDSDAVRKYSTSGFGSLLHFNVSLSAADGLEKDGYLASSWHLTARKMQLSGVENSYKF